MIDGLTVKKLNKGEVEEQGEVVAGKITEEELESLEFCVNLRDD